MSTLLPSLETKTLSTGLDCQLPFFRCSLKLRVKYVSIGEWSIETHRQDFRLSFPRLVMTDHALEMIYFPFLYRKPVFGVCSLYICVHQNNLYTVYVQLFKLFTFKPVFFFYKTVYSLYFVIVANVVYRNNVQDSTNVHHCHINISAFW